MIKYDWNTVERDVKPRWGFTRVLTPILFISFVLYLMKYTCKLFIEWIWIFNIFSSQTTAIKVKFHMKHLWDGATKICSTGPGLMTKMADMAIYGKNLVFSGTKRSITLKLNLHHRMLKYYQVCSNILPPMANTTCTWVCLWRINLYVRAEGQR